MKTKESFKTTDSTNSNSDTKPKKHRQRKYFNLHTNNQQRVKLIDMIEKTKSIRNSAKIVGMNESTAKSIYY